MSAPKKPHPDDPTTYHTGWTNTGWLTGALQRGVPERHRMYFGPYVLTVDKLDDDIAREGKRFHWKVEQTAPARGRYVKHGYDDTLEGAQKAAQDHAQWHLTHGTN